MPVARGESRLPAGYGCHELDGQAPDSIRTDDYCGTLLLDLGAPCGIKVNEPNLATSGRWEVSTRQCRRPPDPSSRSPARSARLTFLLAARAIDGVPLAEAS